MYCCKQIGIVTFQTLATYFACNSFACTSDALFMTLKERRTTNKREVTMLKYKLLHETSAIPYQIASIINEWILHRQLSSLAFTLEKGFLLHLFPERKFCTTCMTSIMYVGQVVKKTTVNVAAIKSAQPYFNQNKPN